MSTPVWAGWAKIQTLLTSAAAAMANPINLVAKGVPSSIATDQIRYWYDGNGNSPFSPGDTLSRSQEGILVRVGVFLRAPVGVSLEAEAALDDRLENADNCIQDALLGDTFLGDPETSTNEAIGLRIEDTSTSFENVTGTAFRYLEIPLVYGVPDRHVIGR